MRWLHLLFPAVVETPQGLFRPSHPAIDFGLPAIGLLVILGFLVKSLLSGKPNYLLFFYLMLISFGMLRSWRVRCKFGSLGEPIARVDHAQIYLRLPQNVHPGHVQVPLEDVRAIVVKGMPGQRSYVFMRDAGEPLTVRPGFGRLDARVADFLQRTVPASIPVEVQEPPTFLGAIRGE